MDRQIILLVCVTSLLVIYYYDECYPGSLAAWQHGTDGFGCDLELSWSSLTFPSVDGEKDLITDFN